jgi:hypothetical protein
LIALDVIGFSILDDFPALNQFIFIQKILQNKEKFILYSTDKPTAVPKTKRAENETIQNSCGK